MPAFALLSWVQAAMDSSGQESFCKAGWVFLLCVWGCGGMVPEHTAAPWFLPQGPSLGCLRPSLTQAEPRSSAHRQQELGKHLPEPPSQPPILWSLVFYWRWPDLDPSKLLLPVSRGHSLLAPPTLSTTRGLTRASLGTEVVGLGEK